MSRASRVRIGLAAAGTAVVLLGASPADAGTFTPAFAAAALTATSGSSPVAVAIADIDGDGRQDVVSADSAASTVDVAYGNGDGSTGAQRTFATGGTGPTALMVTDFDRDGRADVAVADVSGSVSVLLGDGVGGLGAAAAVSSGGTLTWGLAAADVDRDGDPDLAVANYGSGNVGILLGNGDGTFAPPTTMHVAYSTSRPMSVAAGDLNGDGAVDLAVTARGSVGTVSVLAGNGDGTFTPGPTVSSGGAHPDAVSVADLDGDGFADVVVSDVNLSGTVAVLRSDGAGAFSSLATYPTGGQTTAGIAVADLDGDAIADVAAVNNLSGTIGVLPGNGDGTLGAPVTFATGGTGALDVATGDVNGDGLADVAVDNSGSATIGVLVNTTPRLLTPAVVAPVAGSVVRTGRTIAVRGEVRDHRGGLLSDADAASLAAACRVTFTASGAQSTAPVCMRYDARRDRFNASWRTGRRPGAATLTVSISYQGTTAVTSTSVPVTIVR